MRRRGVVVIIRCGDRTVTTPHMGGMICVRRLLSARVLLCFVKADQVNKDCRNISIVKPWHKPLHTAQPTTPCTPPPSTSRLPVEAIKLLISSNKRDMNGKRSAYLPPCKPRSYCLRTCIWLDTCLRQRLIPVSL
jgi:hypothetical protein